MRLRALGADAPELAALEVINTEAIPEEERCSLRDMLATGAEVLCVEEAGEPVGYLAVRNWRNLVYLAFFAVRSDLRSRGIGGQALRELTARNPDRQVVVEFEAPDPARDDGGMNFRRKQFYLRNGFYETGWNTRYDGTEFEIACSSPEFDAEGFIAFAEYISGVVSDHIPNPFRKVPE